MIVCSDFSSTYNDHCLITRLGADIWKMHTVGDNITSNNIFLSILILYRVNIRSNWFLSTRPVRGVRPSHKTTSPQPPPPSPPNSTLNHHQIVADQRSLLSTWLPALIFVEWAHSLTIGPALRCLVSTVLSIPPPPHPPWLGDLQRWRHLQSSNEAPAYQVVCSTNPRRLAVYPPLLL